MTVGILHVYLLEGEGQDMEMGDGLHLLRCQAAIGGEQP